MWQLLMSKGGRRWVTAVPLCKPGACRIPTGCPYCINLRGPSKGTSCNPHLTDLQGTSPALALHFCCILAAWVSNVPRSKQVHKHSSDQHALYLPKCGWLSAPKIYCLKTVPLGLNQLLPHAFVDSCHVSLPVYELEANAENKVKR